MELALTEFAKGIRRVLPDATDAEIRKQYKHAKSSSPSLRPCETYARRIQQARGPDSLEARLATIPDAKHRFAFTRARFQNRLKLAQKQPVYNYTVTR